MAKATINVSLSDANLEQLADMVTQRLAKLMPPIKWTMPDHTRPYQPNYSPGLPGPIVTC